MKVALILSGHLRCFDVCKKSLEEHILKHYDTDIYVHTWKDLDLTYHSKTIRNFDEKQLDIIKSIPNVKDIIIQDYNELKSNFLIDPRAERFLSQFYKVNQSFNMVKGKKYDIVIRSRPDIYYNQKLELNNDGYCHVPTGTPQPRTELLGSNFPNLPEHVLKEGTVGKDSYLMAPPSDNTNGIVDCFAYGNYATMKEYCSMYEKMPKYMDKFRALNYNPEALLSYHLNYNFIQANRFNYEFYIMRNWRYL